MDMLIHHEGYLPDCTEYFIAELPPLIVDEDEFAAAFIEALARTEGPDTAEGDYICSHCIGLAMVGETPDRLDDDRDDDFDKYF